MWKILLADNTELPVTWCGANQGVLWVDGLTTTLMEAITIFSDSTKTARIVAPGGIIHENYTNLIHLSLTEGLLKVALKKEV